MQEANQTIGERDTQGGATSDNSATDLPRLVLFSGFAIDSRFLAKQKAIRGARVETPDWIPPVMGESLREYTSRLVAARVAPSSGPLWLGGASFGGMVAMEAARILKPRGVFLIAAGLSHRALWKPLETVGRYADRMPERMLRDSRRFLPLGFRLAGPLHRTDRDYLVKLFAAADPHFVRWGGPAMTRWEWTGPLPCPVYHIHGERDPMVPLRKVRPRPDVVIPKAGHAINVTHAAEVNAFIEQRMNE